jgi:hypothetical protein
MSETYEDSDGEYELENWSHELLAEERDPCNARVQAYSRAEKATKEDIEPESVWFAIRRALKERARGAADPYSVTWINYHEQPGLGTKNTLSMGGQGCFSGNGTHIDTINLTLKIERNDVRRKPQLYMKEGFTDMNNGKHA